MFRVAVGMAIGLLFGTVISAHAARVFYNVGDFLNATPPHQIQYIMGVYDALAFVADRHNPQEVKDTVDCMNATGYTAGPLAKWAVRRLAMASQGRSDSAVDSLMVFRVHPCTD